MMLLGSQFNRKQCHGTSYPVYSTPVPPHSVSTEKSDSSPASLNLNSPPTWITQALCELTQGEQELNHLGEQQTSEVDKVNQSLDSAIFSAQKEERRLLEKVEKDHREAEQRLLQLKRENAAAARVGQLLLDQQLRKISQLKEQILMWGRCPNGPNKSLLLQGVKELIQPWEISLSLKRVTYQPSAQSNPIYFGDIHVQEHSLTFPVGVCGPKGQKCAIHTGEMFQDNHVAVSEQLSSPCTHSGVKEASKTNSGSNRVVRKIRLSSADEDVSVGRAKSASPKICKLWPCKRENSESSIDDDLLGSDSQGEDLFLAIPPSSKGQLDEEKSGSGQTLDTRHSYSKDQMKLKGLISLSSKEPSCPPEERRRRDRGINQEFQRGISSPMTAFSKCKSSYSCTDLLTKDQTQHYQNLGSPGRSPSPADSLDSSYTFTIWSGSSSCGCSPTEENPQSTSTVDLSARGYPGKKKTQKLNKNNWTSLNLNYTQEIKRNKIAELKDQPLKPSCFGPRRVCRSLSMSEIEERGTKPEFNRDRNRRDHSESGLQRVHEESQVLNVGHLVKKFGRQGSGRTDFTLPSGVHVTPQGQLFIADCGNVRVQVTDQQRNVVQQVTLPASDRTSRHCHNLFDVASNSKGLIALTCAAERAVLVFNRHGRLLQTYGGSGPQHDFEAPRGVTVTRLDEFLVADIRRGTLTALKLDPKLGAKIERTVVTGFYRPYLVAACLVSGLIAVSERGNETGRAPCIRVLEPGWNTIRTLGVCSGLGPVLTSPWGICIDAEGNVLVADWGQLHRVVLYPAVGMGRSIVSHGLSSPRGLALLPDGLFVVADSMNHCIKIYRYK